MRDKIIVAIDVNNLEEMTALADKLKGEATFVKVGMELYLSEGPKVIKILKEYGYKIFLDLKLHDIPNTVMKTCKSLTQLGVDIFNVHAAGGSDMLKGAALGIKQGLKEGQTPPLLIAVTQLTSTNDETLKNDLLIDKSLNETITSYAKLAKDCGLGGVVCSARETQLIKEACGSDFKTITPGIRPAGSQKDDQARVMTPAEAIKIGTDYMVIGRPITQQLDPRKAYQNILAEIQNV